MSDARVHDRLLCSGDPLVACSEVYRQISETPDVRLTVSPPVKLGAAIVVRLVLTFPAGVVDAADCRFTISLAGPASPDGPGGRVRPVGEGLSLAERHLTLTANFDRAASPLPAELLIESPLLDSELTITILDGDEVPADAP